MPACLVLLAIMLLLMPVHAPARTLTMVAVEWPPYTSAHMPGNGLLTQIVRKAMSRMGHTVNVVFVPWARALEMVRTGQCDGIIGVAPNEDRHNAMFFANPIIQHTAVLFRRTGVGSPTFDRMDELCPARVGVLRGSLYVDFLQKTPCLELIELNEPLQGIKMLLAGRITYQLEDPLFMAEMLSSFKSDERTSIQAMHPAISYSATTVAFSRAAPENLYLTDAFDTTMAQLGKEGIHAAMLVPHGLSIPPEVWVTGSGTIQTPH